MKTGFFLIAGLWLAQGLLSATLLWAAYMKLFAPAEKLAMMWPWTSQNRKLVFLTGILDTLAGIGLILPELLNFYPQLTFFAALGLIALMVAAVIFHLSRGEGTQIGFNLFVLIITAFIAWGRSSF